MGSRSLCLVDTMVLIDGAKHGFLEPLLKGHEIGVAAAAAREVRYWKDQAGMKHPIDLTPHVAAGRLTVMWATSRRAGVD